MQKSKGVDPLFRRTGGKEKLFLVDCSYGRNTQGRKKLGKSLVVCISKVARTTDGLIIHGDKSQTHIPKWAERCANTEGKINQRLEANGENNPNFATGIVEDGVSYKRLG